MIRENFDLVLVGGGIVGLATAWAISQRGFGSLAVIEAEETLAAHQSGRNSGVIHSGLYYPPGSLKTRLCAEGRERLYRFCESHRIAHRRCGKLVIASSAEQLPALEILAKRGRDNGLEGLEWLDGRGLKTHEPAATGAAALRVRETGVVDYRRVCQVLADEVERHGGVIRRSERLLGIEPRSDRLDLRTTAGAISAGAIINCAGLYSDRVTRLAGAEPGCRIVPFRGEYFEVRGAVAKSVRGPIYPVPDPSLPFLGVHLTRTVDGRLLAGPNAVPALSREGYTAGQVRVGDLLETATFPGFWRLVWHFRRAGIAEVWRSVSRRRFARDLARLVPGLAHADLVRSPSGVRAQAIDRQGRMLHDFLFAESERALHVINAPSPAATAALAIGRYLAERAADRFGW